MPKVSVIIPLYNGKKYIKETLDSVFEQTYLDYEVIVINDGSTDQPEEVLDEYRDKIKLIRQENSGSPAGAKNTGIRNSKGEYLAFLDQDDLWEREKLAQQVKIFENQSEVNLVACNVGIISDGGKTLIPRVWPYPEIWDNCDLKDRLAKGNIILTSSSVMVRKDVFKGQLLFNEKLKITDDYELWYRISRSKKIVLMPKVLAYWRYHENNSSKMSEKTRIDTVNYYRELVLDRTLTEEELKMAEANLRVMNVRLANYYLSRGKDKEAMEIYREISPEKQSKAVRLVLFVFGIHPSLARLVVRLKIGYSTLLSRFPHQREIIFPGGGVL